MTLYDSREPFAAPPEAATVSGSVVADEALLTRARALGPIIRQHAATTERERRLARPVVAAMREAGLFRMFKRAQPFEPQRSFML